MDRNYYTETYINKWEECLEEARKENAQDVGEIARYIFDPIYSPLDNNQSFGEIMYDRLMGLIQMIDKDTFDLSRYQEMFQKAEACNYKDDTIGII